VQVLVVPPPQVPPLQVWPVMQAFPVEHVVPLAVLVTV